MKDALSTSVDIAFLDGNVCTMNSSGRVVDSKY